MMRMPLKHIIIIFLITLPKNREWWYVSQARKPGLMTMAEGPAWRTTEPRRNRGGTNVHPGAEYSVHVAGSSRLRNLEVG